MNHSLDCAGKQLDLSSPKVMGVLNVTPDSFSDGGKHDDLKQAVKHAQRMVEEGASIIDIGGESTRPGAEPVSVEGELARVLPVIELLVSEGIRVPISIDTSKPEVMRAAFEAGAGMINDVRALQEPGALEVVADIDIPVCLMHMQGRPRTMQEHPVYENVVQDILHFLRQRVEVCEQAGIAKDRLLIDPGFGFGKTLEQNYSLLKHLDEFRQLGLPVLVGLSRKSMIGNILDEPVEQRLFGSLAGAALAAWNGANIIRVHDVKPTCDVVKVIAASQAAE